jgi:hypothetical protein
MGLIFFVIQHFLPSETDGCTFADYRPLQALAGRQTVVRQNELLVNVQEAENGYDSLWHRESHILPLRKSFCFFFLTKNQEITSFNYSIGNGLETS